MDQLGQTITLPSSTVFFLLGLAAYGLLVSGIMFSVAVINFYQRMTFRGEVRNLEIEFVKLRQRLEMISEQTASGITTGELSDSHIVHVGYVPMREEQGE